MGGKLPAGKYCPYSLHFPASESKAIAECAGRRSGGTEMPANRLSQASFLLLGILIVALLLTVLFLRYQQKSALCAQTGNSSYPTTDGHILWEAGWETGNASQWSIHAGGHWGESRVDVVTCPVRYGKYAGKLTLNPGSGNVRAEISATQQHTGGYPGQAWYYSFSVYFPSKPDQSTAWSDWNDFTQWMDMRANCSPPLQFDVKADNTLVFHNEITYQKPGNCGYGTLPSKDYPLDPIVYDQWIDFTAHIKWSENPQVGYAEVWRNGEVVVPLTHMQTLDPDSSGVYMEQAMYRPGPTRQAIIYIDGTRRHTAYQAGNTNPQATISCLLPQYYGLPQAIPQESLAYLGEYLRD